MSTTNQVGSDCLPSSTEAIQNDPWSRLETIWNAPPELRLSLQCSFDSVVESSPIQFGWRFGAQNSDALSALPARHFANKSFALYVRGGTTSCLDVPMDLIYTEWIRRKLAAREELLSPALGYFAATPISLRIVPKELDKTAKLREILIRLIEVHLTITSRVKEKEGLMATEAVAGIEPVFDFSVQGRFADRFLLMDVKDENKVLLVGSDGWWAGKTNIGGERDKIGRQNGGWQMRTMDLVVAVKLILDDEENIRHSLNSEGSTK